MKVIENTLNKFKPMFTEGGKFEKLYPMFEGLETFLLTPDHATKQGAHVRDPADLKRMMVFVDYALLPCILFACWNVGYQADLAEGTSSGLVSQMIRGLRHFLPLYAVTLAVGGAWELLFCIVRKHEINEGFLVTSLLFPLICPPNLPLWMAAMGISFGIVIGKEVFGGVGFNILNPALTARAFVFFSYPGQISGSKTIEGLGVWTAAGQWMPGAETVGADKLVGNAPALVSGSSMEGLAVDGFTGATPLLSVSNGADGTQAVDILAAHGWTFMDLFYGFVPGSMGETSALACLLGAAFLIITGIGSWRIMTGCVVGMLAVSSLFYFGIDSTNPLMSIPPHYHLVMGGFAFGTVFMATDPVSAAVTHKGRWLYGIFIGMLCALIRVVNPAYPEGMMLAILFMNVFSPLLDYYVVKASTRRRTSRMAE